MELCLVPSSLMCFETLGGRGVSEVWINIKNREYFMEMLKYVNMQLTTIDKCLYISTNSINIILLGGTKQNTYRKDKCF